MAKKTTKLRPWTKEDADPEDPRAREDKDKCDRAQLKRSLGATYQKAGALGVTLGEGLRKKRA